MRCPKCGSKDKLQQIWSHNDPASSALVGIFGLMAPIFYSAARRRYRCGNCHLEFRSHSLMTGFFLAVSILIALTAVISILFIILAFAASLLRE